MGYNATAILAYGYDLGETFGWDYNEPEPDWYQDDEGWRESAELALLAAVGFTETDWRADDFFERKAAAWKSTGVDFSRHGGFDDPSYLLVAKAQRTDWNNSEPVDLTLPDNADERLAWALNVLGIEPPAERPQWLLAAFYG